jgi:predicted enzyme related to lactoylglutathione lyase
MTMKDSTHENPLARHGGLSYLELPALDPAQSAAFYSQVLGWKIDQRSDDDFRFADGQGLLIGRWVRVDAVAQGRGPVPFYYVSDLDRAIEYVGECRCEVVEAVKLEGDLRLARVRDPAGNTLGLWQFMPR